MVLGRERYFSTKPLPMPGVKISFICVEVPWYSLRDLC